MHIGQALDLVSRYDSLRNPLTSLGDYLDPELISRCLAESGTVTLRKRRLPLEMMVWCIVGMALERKEPLHQIVNRLDIMLPGNRPFVAPSAVIQARQRLGSEAVRRVFTKTAQLWHNATPHPQWCGLTLLAIDGVFWRTPDTPENDAAFPRQTHAGKSSFAAPCSTGTGTGAGRIAPPLWSTGEAPGDAGRLLCTLSDPHLTIPGWLLPAFSTVSFGWGAAVGLVTSGLAASGVPTISGVIGLTV